MSNSSPKNSYVTDTMALVLRLERRKSSQQVKWLFEQVEQNQAIIYVPALVLAEVLYLSEKRRIECNLDNIKAYLSEFTNIIEMPLDFSVMLATRQITDIAELHDRIIAGTALALNLPLITNDPIITASQFVQTIW